MIGRNDACYCGSGKKYKKCHLKYDEELTVFKRKGYVVPTRKNIKTVEQIEGIKKSAVVTKALFDYLEKKVVAGITTGQIDEIVHKFTIEHGGTPATLGYHGFPKSCCTSVNDVVCHGIPDDYELQDGDILNIDLTTILGGYYSDSSRMYLIGNVTDDAKRLVKETYNCMMKGIEAVKPLQSVDIIGETIEKYAHSLGYSVVEALGGHGVGIQFHEDPHIHHYKSDEKGMIMVPGMVFTIEPMINEGGYEVEILEDEWTVVTLDGSLSAQWEHTILVTEKGYEIIT